MIYSSLKFRYNGIDSDTMKLVNVTLSSGLMEEPLVAERELNEIQIKGRDRPYFQNITLSPLVFDLNFAFTEPWNKALISQIKQWLCQNYYKPFILSDDISTVGGVEVIDKIYYCILVSEPKILHNGLSEGYCTLQFRCDSPYAYSPITTVPKDCSVNPVGGTSLTINNTGDVNCYPKITITKVGDGANEADVSIINTSNANLETKFTTSLTSGDDGIVNAEVVTLDNERKTITTSLFGISRYNAFNDVYFYLIPGANVLTLKGNAVFSFQLEYRYL